MWNLFSVSLFDVNKDGENQLKVKKGKEKKEKKNASMLFKIIDLTVLSKYTWLLHF